MSYTEAVYLGSIVGALLFFAAGYTLATARSAGRSSATTASQTEVGVEELIQELQHEQALRRQHEDTIQQLQAMLGQLQMRGG